MLVMEVYLDRWNNLVVHIRVLSSSTDSICLMFYLWMIERDLSLRSLS